ncbi:MAG: calcium-translocating P-type ATPase, SERCA-type [Nanoarchaeota archaeon]|nr:calcium-translocating P-type ATPase, SERCA-type [Nanoarchaeota archaeon]
MEYYKTPVVKVISELNGSVSGISEEDARERLEKYGKNEIKREKHISALQIFLSQFKDFLIWILIFATVISGITGEYIDMTVIAIILILNAVLGFYQEFKAEKSIEALQKLASLKALVLRSGSQERIDATEIVPGDILIIEEGGKIPADARIIEAIALQTQEASLTGESVPNDKTEHAMEKICALGDRASMLYAGTIVTRGHGKAIVTETGMKTELGKIAKSIESAKSPLTPLQLKLKRFSKLLAVFVILICGIVFFTGYSSGYPLMEIFLASISLAVAAVPEGLPAVVTITLSLGMQKLSKKNVLIRTLPSVETLGCTTVICSDKTGTLTHNEMTVTKVFVDGKELTVTGDGYSTEGKFSADSPSLKQLLKIGVLCNNGSLGEEVVGDPTEVALLVSAAKKGLVKVDLEKTSLRIEELPFDSKRKLMTTVHKIKGKKFALVKGAPDVIILKCTKVLIDGEARVFSRDLKAKALEQNKIFARQALRVLGFAYKEVKFGKVTEESLIFVGLQGMIDPPRKEAITSVAKCKTAKIKVVMITGDYIETAKAVAKELGIEGRAVTGEELDKMGNLADVVDKIAIYARVDPEHKMRIVEALQKNGHVVAMTGDGVNDAPALKAADIGIAMGITGTDVSKEASDMILTDDNFSSIVNAVEEGRTIYDNIEKFVEFLLSCNAGEVLAVFLGVLMKIGYPLIAIQILWMNLITDGLPALALGVDPKEPGVMERPPRKKETKILGNHGLQRVIIIGIIMCIGTLGIYWLYKPAVQMDYARTMAFTTLVMFQLVHVFNCRSLHHSLFKVGVWANKKLWYAVIISLFLQIAVIYTPLNQFFRTVPLNLYDWGFVILIAVSIFVIREIWKMVRGHA